jgi:hypothetical protein
MQVTLELARLADRLHAQRQHAEQLELNLAQVFAMNHPQPSGFAAMA